MREKRMQRYRSITRCRPIESERKTAMQTLISSFCLLLLLLHASVLADNVAFEPTDILRDGRHDTCGSAAWAVVDLPASFNVTHIRVYTDDTRSVKVLSNCTALVIRSSSFVDFFCTSPSEKSSIIITNMGRITCEVEVGTCPVDSSGKRYYGTACTTPCSDSCLNGLCGSNTGTCSSCPSDRTGPHCDGACDDGKFGDCRKLCACRNGSEVCHKSTGQCQSGCRDGRKGEDCQQGCPDRYFGNCKTPCRCRNPNEVCDKVTGNCKSGCPDGKSGGNCYECADGMYGNNCGSTCPKTCVNSSCHHATGHCALGCVEGWEGYFCNTKIPLIGLGLGLGLGLGTLLLVVLALLAAFCYWRRLQERSVGKTGEAHQLEERHVYERVDEEIGRAVQPALPHPDASAKEEEENVYEKIEELEDRPRMAAPPGIESNPYESLDIATATQASITNNCMALRLPKWPPLECMITLITSLPRTLVHLRTTSTEATRTWTAELSVPLPLTGLLSLATVSIESYIP